MPISLIWLQEPHRELDAEALGSWCSHTWGNEMVKGYKLVIIRGISFGDIMYTTVTIH